MRDIYSSKRKDYIMSEIEVLIEKADKQFHYKSFKKAHLLYEKALAELPEPKIENEYYLEIMAAIGDTLIAQGKNVKALELFDRILKAPNGDESAFLHLRKGQVAFELDRMEIAEVELKRAYELGGEEIFEDEHEEYLDCALGRDYE